MDLFNSRYILQEKRWLWIDYDKGISIMLVGFGHCCMILNGHNLPFERYPFINYINTFLYGFRMPLFFIVSGLLVGKSLNKKGVKGYISDRTNNILYPLFVWGIIQVTMELFAASITHNHVTAMNYLDLIIRPREDGHFWYLNALFFIGSIYAILKSKLKIPPLAQLALGFGLYSINAYIRLNSLDFGLFNDICEYYFFFALGDVVSKIMLAEGNIDRFSSWKIFVPLIILFVAVQYYFTKDNIKPTIYGVAYIENMHPFLFMAEALLGCVTSVSFSFLLQKYKVLTFIRIVGYHSLFIYCMQIIMMSVARILCMNVFHLYNVPALVLIVWTSGVILPVFIYNFCLKYGLWWLYTYRKPEKQVAYMKTANIFWFDRKKKDPEKKEPLYDTLAP
ncbi:MAG: acyltransferase [Bacteroidetes bacterium]|nr:acyltransferase [Bacteroidota bacterium]